MSQVCGGGSDRKIACEPVAAAEDDDTPNTTDDIHDFVPPDSFWLSADAEFDWFDRNAFLERSESTKRNSTNMTRSNSTSTRFSVPLKSRASIIGLPKTQKNNHVDKRRNTKPANVRLFPQKRSDSTGKSTAPPEPSSPKVSCIGRVRSKRGRRRKAVKPEKPAEKTREKKKGIRSAFMSLFQSDRAKPAVKTEEPLAKSCSRKSRSFKTKRPVPGNCEVAGEPPGLGGVKRFVSGRRPESWGAEVD